MKKTNKLIFRLLLISTVVLTGFALSQSTITVHAGSFTETPIGEFSKTTTLSQAKKQTIAELKNLAFLSDKRRQEYQTAISSKKSLDTLKITRTNAIAENERIGKALRTKAKAAIQKYLFLSESRKKAYIDAFDKRYSQETISQTATNAINENKKNKSTQQQTAIKNTKKLVFLSTSRQTAYADAFSKRDSPDAIKTTYTNAISENTRIQSATQAAATRRTNSLRFLSDARKKAYADAFTKRTQPTTIQTTLNNGINEDKKLMASAQKTATIAVNKMPFVTDARKKVYAEAFTERYTPVTIQKTRNNAVAEDTRAEATAKSESAKIVNSFKYMSTKRRNEFLDAFKTRKSLATLTATTTNAINEESKLALANSDQHALKVAREYATNQINSLANLSSAEKTKFIKDISQAANTNNINAILTQAKNADKEAATNIDQNLATAKTKAIETINKLSELTADEKVTNQAAINKATTTTAINNIVSKAQTTNAVRLARKAAVTKVSNLSDLTTAQLNSYKTAIAKATTTAAIDKLVDDATKQNTANNTENNSAQTLADAKTKAIDTINKLSELTADEKATNQAAINKAATTTAINNVVSKAQTTNTVRVARKTALISLNKLTSLTSTQINGYKSTIAKATTTAAIDKVIADATKQNTANKNDGDTAQKELATAKAKAIDTINKLPYLINKMRAEFITQVKAATSVSTIKSILSNAEAKSVSEKPNENLNIQKDNMTDTVASDKYLSDTQKRQYIDRINNATKDTEILEIVKDFQNESAYIRDNAKLTTFKTKTIAEINAFQYITKAQKDDYASRIQNVTLGKTSSGEPNYTAAETAVTRILFDVEALNFSNESASNFEYNVRVMLVAKVPGSTGGDVMVTLNFTGVKLGDVIVLDKSYTGRDGKVYTLTEAQRHITLPDDLTPGNADVDENGNPSYVVFIEGLTGTSTKSVN